MLGIDQTGDNFFQKTWSAIEHLDAVSWPTAALAAGTIAGLYALKRTHLPGALLAVGAGIVVGATGVLTVALTGDVPNGLPSPAAPDLALIGPLLPAAAGIALMSFVESVAAGRAIVHADEPDPDANRELLALGAANVAGGVFRALPSGGGLSQTAVNDAAETMRAGAVTGAVGVITLLLLTDLLADLPQATLGALVLVHALDHPYIERLEDGAIRVHGPIYFANVQRVRRRVLELDPDPVLDMSVVTGIDVTAALLLADLAPRMRGLNQRTARVMHSVAPDP